MVGTQTKRVGPSCAVWACATSSKGGGNQVRRIVQRSNENEPMCELIVLVPPTGIVQLARTRVEASAQYGTCKALKLLARTYLERLSSDGWTLSEECPETLFHSGHVSKTTCHGNDLFEEASLQGLCKVEASLRSHFETERLLSSYPTLTVPVRLVLGYLGANTIDMRHPVKKPMSG